ncbi:hypothetical protein EJB05_44160, partial [Eragrostis curvula]
MAPSLCLRFLFLCSVILVHQLPLTARAGDPDILTDFILPHGADPSQINGTFFTYTGLLSGLAAADPGKFAVSKAGAAEFPAVLGQSVSYAALAYGPGAVNPPHIHPRASELLLVTQGTLLVGLVDAARNGTVYAQALQAGDMFVFPKGMVHWQYNAGGSGEARAFSAFGGASPGTISLPFMLFETGIDDDVLEKSFRTDRDTVEELKRDLQQASPSPSSAAVSIRGAAPLSLAAATLLCFGAAFFFVL